MAVYACADCGGLISLSAIPTGNPELRRSPESWVTDWRICISGCGIICGQCGVLECSICKGVIVEPTEQELLSMSLPGSLVAEESDLPHHVRNAKTKAERLERLQSARIKEAYVESEITEFTRVVEEAEYD